MPPKHAKSTKKDLRILLFIFVSFVYFVGKSLCRSIFSQRCQIAVVIPPHLVHRIAAEFFTHRVCKHDSEHCFADVSGGGHGGDVRAFEGGEVFGLGVDIDGMERFAKGRDRLHVAANAKLFAVSNAALETAGPIRSSNES